MKKTYRVGTEALDFATCSRLIKEKHTLVLADEARERIVRCREYLDRKICKQQEPIYGVTTGFGSLCDQSISPSALEQLQKNLMMSHACGMGEEVPQPLVRLMLFLKIRSLAFGHSGVRMETVDRLIGFYNHEIHPLVYTQGSLGASGDLAPLAHLCLPLIGMGEAWYQGQKTPASHILQAHGWEPLSLASKEGLALLNGTQFMGAYGVYCLLRAFDLLLWADLVAALSLEAYHGRIEPFMSPVHRVRPHPGQQKTAARIMDLLQGSRMMQQKRNHVQDPYSFRCVPQVHGASSDAVDHVAALFRTEMNSVTDNPTLFPEEDLILSAGNFHGQGLAMGLDYLGIALAELGSIAERRVYRLISGSRGLPSFLVANPGLNSGFMIPQYTAASIVSQNKQLCTPASVDTIESSQGQEDHVSMGANAAVKTLQIVLNLEKVLGIELMCAAQAMSFRKPEQTSPTLTRLLEAFVREVPFVEEDRLLYKDMEKARQFIRDGDPKTFLP